jgi:hypothetical protein
MNALREHDKEEHAPLIELGTGTGYWAVTLPQQSAWVSCFIVPRPP